MLACMLYDAAVCSCVENYTTCKLLTQVMQVRIPDVTANLRRNHAVLEMPLAEELSWHYY